jgi:hypothetical protein
MGHQSKISRKDFLIVFGEGFPQVKQLLHLILNAKHCQLQWTGLEIIVRHVSINRIQLKVMIVLTRILWEEHALSTVFKFRISYKRHHLLLSTYHRPIEVCLRETTSTPIPPD